MESSFQISICECPDISASTMAVDMTGRFAMVSGRKCMGLIDLDGNDCDLRGDLENSDPNIKRHPNDGQRSATTPKVAPICKRIARNTKYDPTASHFNRHIADLYALTACQIVEVFSIEDLNPVKPKLVLRGHSRAIADIEWSCFDAHLLGSSGADCLTNLWDIRDSRRPSACLTSVSGATLVRFSKTSSNLIATSHEIDVRIWDIRQPNLPLYYIAAHLQKINGMDWNPNKSNCDHEQLITCSQDNTIKLWDLNANKIRPSASLQTRTSAWRIRYTPVSSYSILTSTLPQLRSRSDCMALKLWSMKPNRFESKKLEMILGLVGHSDVIVDFDWRNRATNGCCEIVSWSKDQTLRVWRVDNQFIEMNVDNSDFEAECETQEATCDSADMNSVVTAENSIKSPSLEPSQRGQSAEAPNLSSPLRSPKSIEEGRELEGRINEKETLEDGSDPLDTDTIAENLPTTNDLKQEFNLINKSIPNIEFEELNWLRRVCLITARAKSVTCRLRIALPPAYPHNECPVFNIIDSNQYGNESLSKEAREKLLNLLNETAKAQLSRNRNCLEPCLRKFIAALQKLTSQSAYRKRAAGSTQDYKDDPITLSAQRDHSIPFPPTSKARFCGNLLVCFGRPMIHPISTSAGGGESANLLVETPRSMAQLSAQLDNMRRQGSYNLSNISISYFYYGAMRRAELQSRSGKSSSSSGRTSSKYLAGRAKSGSLTAQTIMSKSYKCGPVVIYDVSSLLGGICRELAEAYVFDRDAIKMCRRNAQIAAAHNRKDLVQIWSLAELSSEGVMRSYVPIKEGDSKTFSLINHDSDFGDRPWTMHPFGSKLIQSLIDHYVYNCHDVQTAAMLVWTFSSPKMGRSLRVQNSKFSPPLAQNVANKGSVYMLSNYHTVTPGLMNYTPSNRQQALAVSSSNNNNSDAISDEWSFVNAPETHLYSNSWSNSTNEEQLIIDSRPNDSHKATVGNKNVNGTGEDQLMNSSWENKFPRLNILNPERSLQNDLIMHIYAEFLYRLNLLNQRAMVLKNIGSNSSYSEIFGDKRTQNDIPEERLSNLTVQCHNSDCGNKCHSVQCTSCKKYSLYCSICRLPVKGSCSICLKCLHGGHVNHFNTWFNSYDFCPTGCGCKCLSSQVDSQDTPTMSSCLENC